MRLFVAAYPSPEASAALAAALPPLPPQWRPPAAEQWHLTLAFLGEVDEDHLPELTERLSRAAGRCAPLELAFEGAGAFPSLTRARVFWSGLRGDRAALTRLAERVGAAARRSGIEVADRRYRPHLTLARCREPRGDDATRLVAALTSYAGPAWSVQEILLMRSLLGPPVRHSRQRGFRLTG